MSHNKVIGLDKLKDTFSELNQAFDDWDKLTQEALNGDLAKQSLEKRASELFEEVKKQLEVFNSLEKGGFNEISDFQEEVKDTKATNTENFLR